MSQYKMKLFFSAPLEKVWDIWVDVEKTPEWVYGVQASEPGEGTFEEGYSWKEACLFDNLPVPMEHSVTECEKQRKTVIYTVLPMGGTLEKTVLFTPADGGVHVEMEASWELGMIAAFLSADRIREKMEEGFTKTADNWKSRAES